MTPVQASRERPLRGKPARRAGALASRRAKEKSPRQHGPGRFRSDETGARLAHERVCGPDVVLTIGGKGAREDARVKTMSEGCPQTAGRASRSGAGLNINRIARKWFNDLEPYPLFEGLAGNGLFGIIPVQNRWG
jgi:hypothetical protein